MDEQSKNQNNLYVPGAILFAGLMIAGAIMYAVNPSVFSSSSNTAQVSQTKSNLIQEVVQQLGVNKDQFNACVTQKKYKEKIDADQALGVGLGINGTPGGFVNGQQFSGAISYDQDQGGTPNLKQLIDSELNGKKTSLPASIVITANDHIRGNMNALVTIVEFGDFQCPFCQRFHPVLQQAVKDYGDKVRWVYKQFPLTQIHQYADGAAEASECITEQKGNDGFWKFADSVFTNQDRLGPAL